MNRAYEHDRVNLDALNELYFSEEAKSRMTQALLNAQQPVKRRTHRPLRTTLIAAAACIALTITAVAAVPTIWNAMQADQGIFSTYAQTIKGAVSTDQGIEIQVLSALFDDVRGWVYFSVRDTEGDRLNNQLKLSGSLNVSEEIRELDQDMVGSYSIPGLSSAKLVSYDPDTKTALFVESIWYGNTTPTEKARLTVSGMTTQKGCLQGAVPCVSVTSATLESRPVTEEDQVILSPSDVVNAPYDDSVLPDQQVVLTPGQTPMEIEGNEDMWISSMGFASDGCFHVRLEFAEGVGESEEIVILSNVETIDNVYDGEHSTILMRRVENGLDILFPLIHTDEAEKLTQVELSGLYTRPGVEIAGDWSIDFEMEYHASTVLNWTGELNGLQVTRVTISPLSVTVSSTGRGTFAFTELSAVRKDGSVVTAEPGQGVHNNRGAATGVEDWVNYNTWEFTEPVNVEDIVSLTLLGEGIPVDSGT